MTSLYEGNTAEETFQKGEKIIQILAKAAFAMFKDLPRKFSS